MDFPRRRDFRGAFRARPEGIRPEDFRPEYILQDAIARHRALRDREEVRAKQAAPAPARKAARNTAEQARRARFAEALARAAFGRFYSKERPK